MENLTDKKISDFNSNTIAYSVANTVAVVVTFNRKGLLKECVEALLKQDEKCFVLIVDNASTDGTEELVRNHLAGVEGGERIIYKNTGENLGGAGGFNFGIKEAMKLNAEYIWLMDDDCIVKNDSLTELLSYAKKSDNNFGFLSSAVRWSDGSVCKMNVQRKSITRSINDFEKTQRIEVATFVSLFLNSDAVKKCGLPIKEFFIWGDDWEYTSRISRKYKNYYVPKSVVTHKSENNIGSDISVDEGDKITRYFYAYRNEKYTFSKLGLKERLYFALKIKYHKMKILLSHSQNKKEKLDIINKGLKAAKAFKPEIEFVE